MLSHHVRDIDCKGGNCQLILKSWRFHNHHQSNECFMKLKGNKLTKFSIWIKKDSKFLSDSSYFHVKRHLKYVAEKQTNISSNLQILIHLISHSSKLILTISHHIYSLTIEKIVRHSICISLGD